MDETTIWKWQAGRKEHGFLPVYGEDAELPLTVVCGEKPGPGVLISAGIHCAEYVGIQAVSELAVELNPAALRGTVVLAHLMNPTGFAHRTMSMVYEDGKNLNRVFPGRQGGTLADRIAYTATRALLRHADAHIDLHGGDGYEEMLPFVFCQGAADPPTAARSRKMADIVDVPYLVVSKTATGGAYNHAGSMGIPGILIERGSLGVWTREEVEADKKDVRNILRSLGVLEGEMEPRVCTKPRMLQRAMYTYSAFTGYWYPRKRAGDLIQAGEILGEVRDCFGNVLEVCEAQLSGIVLYQTRSLNILQNGPMIAYGEI